MAQFRFFLVGSSQAPLVEVEHQDLGELYETITRCRFLQGRLVEIDGHDVGCGVLIPTNRIQMICEAEL